MINRGKKFTAKKPKTEKIPHPLLHLEEITEKEDEEMKEEHEDDNLEEEEANEEEIEEVSRMLSKWLIYLIYNVHTFQDTDYAVNYFDNGEKYLDDSDDCLDEGPTYWS